VYDWFPLREIDAFGYLHHHYSLNADLFDRFDERNPGHYRVFGIDRIVAPAEPAAAPPFTREIARRGRFRVLEVDGGGFAELVDAPYSVNVEKRFLGRAQAKWLSSALPAAGIHPRVRLAEAEPADPKGIDGSGAGVRFPEAPAAMPRGIVRSIERTGEDFLVEVQTVRACVLLLKMTFHPQWKASVDGNAVETMHLFPSYVGVPLEPGAHSVSLRYEPGPLKNVLALVGAVALAAGMAFTRRRTP
jgi:hypothetical protein